jgi:hypothetical protein
MARFNRLNFFPINSINGISEPDLANNYFNELFKVTKDLTYYTIQKDDLQRPDILSFKFYGTDEYWWVILKYNNIEDIWNDLYIGQIISVPDKTDIDSFYMATRAKQRTTN